MNTANLELCKELFELSGWDEKDRYYKTEAATLGLVEKSLQLQPRTVGDGVWLCPAYDLGYLVRKIPAQHFDLVKVVDSPEYIFYIRKNGAIQYEIGADTPEDAACKPAIELFKQGVLK